MPICNKISFVSIAASLDSSREPREIHKPDCASPDSGKARVGIGAGPRFAAATGQFMPSLRPRLKLSSTCKIHTYAKPN
jgi:hypothetical protein